MRREDPTPADPDAGARFERGAVVALRSRVPLRDGTSAVAYQHAAYILRDDPDEISVAVPAGSEVRVRAGRRQGPRGRQLLEADWTGGYDTTAWWGSAVVKVHRPGDLWSVWRWWDGVSWSADRYINLEDPWVRTPHGFDTGDWVLDVVASEADGDWRIRFKDEDELQWLVDYGEVTPDQAASIREAGERAAASARRRDPVFVDDWDARIPDPAWTAARIPGPAGEVH